MNTEEMEKCLAKGELPIDVSIKKWQQIVDGKSNINSGNTWTDCALCKYFFKGLHCSNECPLVKIDDCCLDDYSSFHTYNNYGTIFDDTSAEFRKQKLHYAKKMLNSLKKCKKLNYTGEKKNE